MHARLIFLFLLIPQVLGAATIYVDPALTSDCDGTTYHYDPTLGTGDTCRVSGAGAEAYNTVQEVLWGETSESNYGKSDGTHKASAGDIIYLRGGTYTENYGSTTSGDDVGAAFAVAHQLNGTAWTDGNYTKIASYPGEWAILDGQNTAQYLVGWGLHTTGGGDNTSNYLKYICFERLGITRAYEGGICWAGGPVKVRYCYIYNNCLTHPYTNLGGIFAYVSQGSIIEYNHFYNNSGTTGHNQSHIIIFSDYNGRSELSITTAFHSTIIRYNLFSGSTRCAIHDKAEQYLAPAVIDQPGMVTDMTYKNYGNKYHHNIFQDCTEAIMARQDFEQIYNNIFDNCDLIGEEGDNFPAVHYKCIYNNTAINGYMSESMGEALSWEPLDFNLTMVNNIVSGFNYVDYSPAFGIGVMWDANSESCNRTYTWTGTTVDCNFIHNPGSATRQYGCPNSYYCKTSGASRWISTSSFNTLRSATNYTNATEGLFLGSSGANEYRTDGEFILTGSIAITDGGYDASHPYLSGVTIPAYVGATNPSDDNWVAGVLGLNSTYFTSVTDGSDPSWIEGSGSGNPPTSVSGCSFSGTLK